jgi:uncharacterized CHY-type Zn-finger protein
MKTDNRTTLVLAVMATLFLALAAGFALNLWGHTPPREDIPLVDAQRLKPDTFRKSYAELIRSKGDISNFECNGCHDKGKPGKLTFNAKHSIIVPGTHQDSVVMSHGSHDRNNLCFNCHDEQNYELLQTRDGRELKLSDSASLCGSCHGPTYRDWEAGIHGRTGGFWDEKQGARTRQICVDCHNPHNPKIPGRAPFPPPHRLQPEAVTVAPEHH